MRVVTVPLSFAGSAALVRKARYFHAKAAGAQVGLDAEQLSLDALWKAGFQGDVYCGLKVNAHEDVDLLTVSPGGVWACEVKASTGEVSISGNKLRSNGRILIRQPVRQVCRQVESLQRLGVDADPLVVMSEARFTHDSMASASGVPVVAARGLASVVGSGTASAEKVTASSVVLRKLAAEQGLVGTLWPRFAAVAS